MESAQAKGPPSNTPEVSAGPKVSRGMATTKEAEWDLTQCREDQPRAPSGVEKGIRSPSLTRSEQTGNDLLYGARVVGVGVSRLGETLLPWLLPVYRA